MLVKALPGEYWIRTKGIVTNAYKTTQCVGIFVLRVDHKGVLAMTVSGTYECTIETITPGIWFLLMGGFERL